MLALAGCYVGTDDDPDAARAIVPFTDYCGQAREWSDAWAEREQDALGRIDDARARGIDCGDQGREGQADELRLDGRLTCAARVHALAMATRGFEGHVDPEDESDPQIRAERAEYDGMVVEHWAGGPRDAEALVDTLWLTSDSHCADLMSRDFVDVGIGHVGDVDNERGTYWVVVIGSGASPP